VIYMTCGLKGGVVSVYWFGGSASVSDSLFQGILKSPQSMVRLWGERVRCRSDLPLITACI